MSKPKTAPRKESSSKGASLMTHVPWGRVQNLLVSIFHEEGPKRFSAFEVSGDRKGYRCVYTHNWGNIPVLFEENMCFSKKEIRSRLLSQRLGQSTHFVESPALGNCLLAFQLNEISYSLFHKLHLFQSSLTRLLRPFAHEAPLSEALELFLRTCDLLSQFKSKDLGEHNAYVARLAQALGREVSRQKSGPYADLTFSSESLDEIYLAGHLHDIGKIGTLECVLNKKSKLTELQLAQIKSRLDCFRERAKRESLEKALLQKQSGKEFWDTYERNNRIRERRLEEIWNLILSLNRGNVEKTSVQTTISKLKKKLQAFSGNLLLLTPQELDILSLELGTLTASERAHIEQHARNSFEVVALAPWPVKYQRIPQIVLAHHEKLDGSGYPYGLKDPQIPIQSKIITICDIYDALVSNNRSYKEGLSHRRAAAVLQKAGQANQIDLHLLDIFLKSSIVEEVYGDSMQRAA